MSYIRYLSNPESLYVWGDVNRNTYFSWWDGDKHHSMIGVPSDEVDKFFLELHKCETFDYWGRDKPFSHGNMSVVECCIPTGKLDEFGDEEGEFKVKLTLGPNNPDLIMWSVTWEYLKNSFYNHIISIPWYHRWSQKLKGWIRERTAK